MLEYVPNKIKNKVVKGIFNVGYERRYLHNRLNCDYQDYACDVTTSPTHELSLVIKNKNGNHEDSVLIDHFIDRCYMYLRDVEHMPRHEVRQAYEFRRVEGLPAHTLKFEVYKNGERVRC